MNLPDQTITLENHLTLDFSQDLKTDVLNGLSAKQKRLPSKYFYDDEGSRLFEDICKTPEYYVTRTELKLLESIAEDLMKDFTEGDLIELGSGAHWKIQRLLDATDSAQRRRMRYLPIDVSEDAIRQSSQALSKRFPDLLVRGHVADFTNRIAQIKEDRPQMMVLFGSSIGNFEFAEAKDFLAKVTSDLKLEDTFLLSVDRVKPTTVLNAAYNDQAGITAAFNKNVLSVINQQLDADFPLDDFDHKAFFNQEEERIEMHLVAKKSLKARINHLDQEFEFAEGETIHTEISQKYSKKSALKLVEAAGLKLVKWHHAKDEWFSIMELAKVQ
ncbi:MAG: L-histidine N(alpha)-methyltransferase [SAR324 cluster bacterium]|nr:L-histidine N(alpha)-methyltransferase [SAR324 cluster bacterium]